MSAREVRRVQIVDSHTGGEPTRVVLGGGPELAGHRAAEKLADFRDHYDAFRSGVVCEPRGSDVLVGALLVEPSNPACVTGVIFFNNVGYLGMCGHGTIGLLATLAHLGHITPGEHFVETPVGVVAARLHDSSSVSVRDIPAYRFQNAVSVTLPSGQIVTGDIAWGGNWFFLCEDHGLALNFADVEALTRFAGAIRRALTAQSITGRNGAEIDHIELFGPAVRPDAHSRSFVLCPGGAYDRSPCGTGTSAKLACLYADRKLQIGDIWRQESIVGSVFEASILSASGDGSIAAEIRGSAFVTAEATLLMDSADPYCWGMGT